MTTRRREDVLDTIQSFCIYTHLMLYWQQEMQSQRRMWCGSAWARWLCPVFLGGLRALASAGPDAAQAQPTPPRTRRRLPARLPKRKPDKGQPQPARIRRRAALGDRYRRPGPCAGPDRPQPWRGNLHDRPSPDSSAAPGGKCTLQPGSAARARGGCGFVWRGPRPGGTRRPDLSRQRRAATGGAQWFRPGTRHPSDQFRHAD